MDNKQTILSKNKQGIYAQLGRSKMRKKFGLFIVEGIKSVEDSLPRFEAECIVATIDALLPANLRDQISKRNIPLYRVDKNIISKISSLSTPADLIGIYKIPEASSVSLLKPTPGNLYLLLDGIQDPGNLGTIIRTAHWFGVNRIYASLDTVDIYNPKTVQSTMGSLGKVDIVYTDLQQLIRQNPDFPVYGTLLDGENIYQSSLKNSGFILMGNEGKGISPDLRELVTHRLLIPPTDPANHSESLNVAIATAVVLALFRAKA